MDYLPHRIWHGALGAFNIAYYINDALDRFMEKNRDWNDIREPDKFNDIPGLHQRARQLLMETSHESKLWMCKFEEIWNNKRIDFDDLPDICQDWEDREFASEPRGQKSLFRPDDWHRH